MDIQKRSLSLSHDEIIRKKNRIFDSEQKRQRGNVGRIEKIEVRYLGTPNDATMLLNKNLSTPYNCAQHISETKCKTSVIALVDSKFLWDMHRPLQDSCTLQLLNFRIKDPTEVNRVFWRSCSFLLGAVMESTFKENAGLFLHSFPPPSVRSGSFIHDIALNDSKWQPSPEDLRALGTGMIKLGAEDKKIERLEVSHEIALEMFKDNPFKREQLPNISNKHNGIVTLYRVGEHIDISGGPMISSSCFVETCKIASVHKISTPDESCHLYRLQGIALPTNLRLTAFAFNVLVDRAKILNTIGLRPSEYTSNEEHHMEAGPLLQQSAN